MPTDMSSLLFAMMLGMLTMAVALPSVMGDVCAAARWAQGGVFFQAVGWSMLLASGLVSQGGAADWTLSTLAMASISGALALNARAFDLWYGKTETNWALPLIAVVLTLGYGAGFSSYAFRVGWANGLLALQMTLIAINLQRTPAEPIGRWRWLLIVSLIAQSIVTAWRGALGAFTTQMPSFFTPHPVNLAFAMVANVTSTLSLTGILLAHRDEAARALERLAAFDGLTGVLNRRAWLQQCNTALANSIRHRLPLAVLMIDLDYFKRINDSLGHEGGDRALQFFAAALKAASRAGDIVCRYGGEEFCVLVSHADHAATMAFDERMRAILADTARRELGHELSYSGGIAVREAENDSIEAMLRRADTALYRAKALGRRFTLDSRTEQGQAQGQAHGPVYAA
jgi:diguanylate cyclase (GGDEF)-like protein